MKGLPAGKVLIAFPSASKPASSLPFPLRLPPTSRARPGGGRTSAPDLARVPQSRETRLPLPLPLPPTPPPPLTSFPLTSRRRCSKNIKDAASAAAGQPGAGCWSRTPSPPAPDPRTVGNNTSSFATATYRVCARLARPSRSGPFRGRPPSGAAGSRWTAGGGLRNSWPLGSRATCRREGPAPE